jgi:hypothetical protein
MQRCKALYQGFLLSHFLQHSIRPIQSYAGLPPTPPQNLRGGLLGPKFGDLQLPSQAGPRDEQYGDGKPGTWALQWHLVHLMGMRGWDFITFFRF